MLITIHNLSVTIDTRAILTDISFSIDKRQRWAIIGMNGAGKSTLVRCLAGLIHPSAGSVLLNERPLQAYGARQLARIISYVPQAQNRIMPYTVYDYVMMGRFPYQSFYALPTDNDRRIVDAALELTDTGAFAHRNMSTLSGGELQRVLLAGAVSQQTEVLLLDEPTTFLDPLHQQMMYAALARIHDEYGMTIVTVTHDVSAAMKRSSHILALHEDGRCYFGGTAESFSQDASRHLEIIFSLPFELLHTKENQAVLVPGEPR